MSVRIRLDAAPLLAGVAIAAGLFAPRAVAAQDPLGEPATRERERERCICFGDYQDRVAPQVFFRGSRARLGIMLGDPAEVDGRAGVRVEEVVEGGPADRAGIAAGDVVVALDDQPLGPEPTRRLLELMGNAEPGDTVAVAFIRDGRERTARVVLDEQDRPFSFRFDGGDGRDGAVWGREGAVWAAPEAPMLQVRRVLPPDAPSVITIDPFGHGGLELVEVNQALGRYFGVDAGVLVADVTEGSRLGLQPGDVLVAIDGREVRSPRHARSIIGSYLPDEEISMQVVRDRRTITVRGTRGR